MVHENTEAETLDKHTLPEGCRWTDLNSKSGINLLNHYKQMLLNLSLAMKKMALATFTKAYYKRTPMKLNLVQGNTSHQEAWLIRWCAVSNLSQEKWFKTQQQVPLGS